MSSVIQCGCFLGVLILGVLIKKYTALGTALLAIVTKLVMWVAMPCSVISGYSAFQITASVLPVALLSLSTNLMLAWIGSRMGHNAQERAEGMILFTGYNTGCFALPFAQSFFGGGAVVATCVFDAVNALFCCGGSYAMASALYKKDRSGWAATFLKFLLRSHIFLIYVCMLALNLAQIRVPQLILRWTGWISPSTGYLAMLMIGLGFDRRFKLSSLKTVFWPVTVRFAFSILLGAVVLLTPGLLSGLKEVSVINLLAPFTILSPLYIRKYGLSAERASLAISASSFVSALLLSAFVVLCGR